MMKRTIACILIGILLAGCFVAVKAPIMKALMSHANFGVETLVQQKKIDHLFIGSSAFRQSIQTADVKNDNVYLLTYNGNQPFMIQKILEYLLGKGVKIQNLYCDMYVYSMLALPAVSDDRIFLDTELCFQQSLLSEVVEHGEGDFSTIYDGIVSSNNEMLCTWPISYKLINSRYDRGASLPSKEDGLSEEELANLEIKDLSSEFNECQVNHLQELLVLCEQNNINVVFLESPKYKMLAEQEDYVRQMEKYARMLAEKNVKMLLHEYTFCTISFHSELISYYSFDNTSPLLYSDHIHLSGKGRAAFSHVLWKALGIR